MASDLFGRRATEYVRALKNVHLCANAIAGQLTLHAELQMSVPPAWLNRVRCTLVHDSGDPIGRFTLDWQEIRPVDAIAILRPQGETNLMDFVGPDPFWVPVTWIALIDNGLVALYRNPTTQVIPTRKPPSDESLNWTPPSAS